MSGLTEYRSMDGNIQMPQKKETPEGFDWENVLVIYNKIWTLLELANLKNSTSVLIKFFTQN